MKLINTHIIARHLPDITGTQTVQCVFCGEQQISGFPKARIIGPSFMDHDALGAGDGVCIHCAACLGMGQERGKRLMMTSFLATEAVLLRLKREEILAHILGPPAAPFVFGITFSHKKHITFRAPVNMPGQRPYVIRTDNSSVAVYPERLTSLIVAMRAWYEICKETAQEPTWFTKKEIRLGCQNYKRIETYGTARYLSENAVIQPYRGTALLNLLTYALNKSAYEKLPQSEKEESHDQTQLPL